MNEEEQSAIKSGKPVMIFHINSVGQMNPSATTVTNNYYGDQFVPEPDNAAQETDTNSKKKKNNPRQQGNTFKPTDATYTYVYQKERPQAIALLYNALMGKKWLDNNTPLELFEKLFSGESGAFTIRWNLETTQLLWYLFKRMKELNYISRPDGTTKWQIEKSHILSKQGRQIDDWHSQHAPKNTTDVDLLVELLNPLNDIMNQFNRQENRLNYEIQRRKQHEQEVRHENNGWDL